MTLHTQKFIRMRKLIMTLPLLVTPFLIMIFWALGGGKGTAASTPPSERAGLNPGLPDAHFKSERNAWDKLSLYEQAHRDSMKVREARRTDPYVKLDPLKGSADSLPGPGRMNPTLGKKEHPIDDADIAEQRINELYRAIQGPPLEASRDEKQVSSAMQSSSISDDIRNLEMMMEMMQASGNENSELMEMQDVLEKILDVQHPERVKERLREQSLQRPRYAHSVSTNDEERVGLLGSPVLLDSTFQYDNNFFIENNSFFGLGEEVRLSTSRRPPIPAVIHQDQSLVSGAVVKLRLTKGIVVDGIEINGGSFVFGQCALNGERLTIVISAVHAGEMILPVSLSAYDVDGMEGLHIPGAISRDVLKQSSDQTVQGLQLSPLNSSLELQAAGAGIETAKNLLSRKSRLVTVTVKAGHKVLLVDTNQNHNH
jgi:conjugative transposon TraM protein